MKIAIFDIETGPRPEDELADVMPVFKAPANYKDPEKIAAAIEEQRAEWMGKAALSAVTGRVVAIGWMQDWEPRIIDCDNEHDGLVAFWDCVEDAAREHRQIVGFNSNRFDIPFLVRRSWANDVCVPNGVFGARGYINGQVFLDLMDEWACGDRQSTIKLDTLARFLGCGAKNGSGAEFAELWKTDRPKAVEYLENDLKMTCRVAERLLCLLPIGQKPKAAPAPDSIPFTPLSEATKERLTEAVAAKKNPRGAKKEAAAPAPALVLANDDDDY